MKDEKTKTGKSLDKSELHLSVGVIVGYRGKYLMLDRVNPPPGFACPAGHIELGEKPEKAAMREVFEETGIKLGDVEFILEEYVGWNNCKRYNGHHWYLFRAESETDKIIFDTKEEKSLAWYTVEEVRVLNLEPVWKHWLEKVKII